MSIGLYQLRDHEVVRKYEYHYGDDPDHSPCPACGEAWGEPSPVDLSRTLVHAQKCDFVAWLQEPDPEDT